jgi:undecaprenyl-diphosphatase
VRKLLLALLVAVSSLVCTGSTPPPPRAAAASGPAAELSVFDAVILGVVEGVTEFLPISSTGHLIIASRVLGLDSPQPLLGPDGQPMWHRAPKGTRSGELLTMKLAADTYIVVIQFGAIAAVALLYWAQLISMVRGLFGRDPAGLRLLINVMIAFVPAAGIGFLAHDWIDEHWFSVETVIFAQVAGALLMFYAEYWYGKKILSGTRVERTELTPLGAASVGILQCAALCPGTSRSMMTIVGGYFAGLDPRRAAEFSFILGFVTLTAASIYKSFKGGSAMIQVFGWPHVLLGGAVAAVTAAVCVRFLVHWLMRHGLAVFAWYRLALAGVLAAYFYL